MKNAAGDKDCNIYLRKELETAGINVIPIEGNPGEVPSAIMGELNRWTFKRAWYYWIAWGPEIPFSDADRLHETYGQEVRVAGHCGCPSPREWYGEAGPQPRRGVPDYHIDTQEGLGALADVIRSLDWPACLSPWYGEAK